MNSNQVETIVDGLEPIALIVRASYDAEGLQFFTPDSFLPTGCLHASPKRQGYRRSCP